MQTLSSYAAVSDFLMAWFVIHAHSPLVPMELFWQNGFVRVQEDREIVYVSLCVTLLSVDYMALTHDMNRFIQTKK